MIVLAAVLAIAGYANRDLLRIKISSVYAPATPKAAGPQAKGTREGAARGDAPWALSALPECFIETAKTTGSRAFVLAHVPAGASPVQPGTTLEQADCRVRVIDGEALVDRGSDRLRIPPPVRLYTFENRIYLLHSGDRGYELRTYRRVP